VAGKLWSAVDTLEDTVFKPGKCSKVWFPGSI